MMVDGNGLRQRQLRKVVVVQIKQCKNEVFLQ